MENKELEIISMGINGEGIAKENGCVFFVPFALPNERVEVEIDKVKENLNFCKIKNILQKSKNRIEAKCQYFGVCGGCNLQHLDYQESLKFKTNLVKETLKKVAGIDAEVKDTIGFQNFNYRNKMVFPVGRINGKNLVGMFKEKSHEIVEISVCEIADKNINKVLNLFNTFLNETALEGFYQNEKFGTLKYLCCRVLNGVPSVTIVAKNDISKHLELFENLLKKEFKNYSLWVNINTKKTSEIFSENFKFVGGEKIIKIKEFGIDYSVHPYSFMQVNNKIKEKLYEEVLNNIQANERVIDAYSGAGLLTAILAKKAKWVYGIEINKNATNDANLLKKSNNINNIDNINGDTAIKLPEILKNNNCDIVVLDPPKAGVSKDLINSLIKNNIKKIIYVACGLTTLCRDLKLLKESFEIKKIQPFDMFPQTNHVETLVCLSRKSSHEMKLHPSPFEKIKSGIKTIELRLYDEKRQKIKEGDVITFTNNSNGERLKATVKKIHRFDTFNELYENLPLLLCGYTTDDVCKAHPSDMEQYYSVEEQNKYGVVGIELFPPKRITDE